MNVEIVIGRGLACCLRPRTAWRFISRKGRAFVVVAYAAVGYVVALAALMLW